MQSELADIADVSERSVRNHAERLAAFDFVRKTDAGWRFALPFHTDEERGDDILPWFVASVGDTNQEYEQHTLVREVIAEAVYDLLDAERYGDPAGPVGGALFAKPGERIPALRKAWEWLDPWISVVRVLLDVEDTENGLPSGRTTAMVGVELKQTSLVGASMGGS